MNRVARFVRTLDTNCKFAWLALRAWTPRQWLISTVAALTFTALIGFVTVLIPNSIFVRDIAPVWWNYPVWIITSAASGMLLATYVRPSKSVTLAESPESARSARMGMTGGILAWFAVGCPVCNKIALLALGYAGAITWFAPVQPFLALAAMVLTSVALVWRLRGQVSCKLPLTTPTTRTLEEAAL
ncbi:MAG: hypothetical protein ACTHZ9_10380 [Leucobacter sp.]